MFLFLALLLCIYIVFINLLYIIVREIDKRRYLTFYITETLVHKPDDTCDQFSLQPRKL